MSHIVPAVESACSSVSTSLTILRQQATEQHSPHEAPSDAQVPGANPNVPPALVHPGPIVDPAVTNNLLSHHLPPHSATPAAWRFRLLRRLQNPLSGRITLPTALLFAACQPKATVAAAESYIGKPIGTRAVPQFTTGVAKPLTQPCLRATAATQLLPLVTAPFVQPTATRLPLLSRCHHIAFTAATQCCCHSFKVRECTPVSVPLSHTDVACC